MHRQALCENCGIAIKWQPTIVGGKTYCCVGCAHGGPCECDYDNLPQADDVNPMVPHPAFRRVRPETLSEKPCFPEHV